MEEQSAQDIADMFAVSLSQTVRPTDAVANSPTKIMVGLGPEQWRGMTPEKATYWASRLAEHIGERRVCHGMLSRLADGQMAAVGERNGVEVRVLLEYVTKSDDAVMRVEVVVE